MSDNPFDLLHEIHLYDDDEEVDGFSRWLIEHYAQLGVVVTRNGVRQPAPPQR